MEEICVPCAQIWIRKSKKSLIQNQSEFAYDISLCPRAELVEVIIGSLTVYKRKVHGGKAFLSYKNVHHLIPKEKSGEEVQSVTLCAEWMKWFRL